MEFNKNSKRIMFDKKKYSKQYYKDNKEKIKFYSRLYYYSVARELKNIKKRKEKPEYKKIYFSTPMIINFD